LCKQSARRSEDLTSRSLDLGILIFTRLVSSVSGYKIWNISNIASYSTQCVCVWRLGKFERRGRCAAEGGSSRGNRADVWCAPKYFYIYKYIHTYIYTNIYTYAYIYVCVYIYIYVYKYTFICEIYIYVCMYIYIYIHIYMNIYVCIYICIHLHVYMIVYSYVHINIHTQINTQIQIYVICT